MNFVGVCLLIFAHSYETQSVLSVLYFSRTQVCNSSFVDESQNLLCEQRHLYPPACSILDQNNIRNMKTHLPRRCINSQCQHELISTTTLLFHALESKLCTRQQTKSCLLVWSPELKYINAEKIQSVPHFIAFCAHGKVSILGSIIASVPQGINKSAIGSLPASKSQLSVQRHLRPFANADGFDP